MCSFLELCTVRTKQWQLRKLQHQRQLQPKRSQLLRLLQKNVKDPTVKVVFQYQDVEFTEASCVKKAQSGFKKAFKDVELKTLDVYIKPEERKVYYVGNGEFEGFVDL